jgi:hypothetical protein
MEAFDCVEHKILIGELYQYGINGIPHNLGKSCFTNRKQQVQITHKEINI